MFRGAHSARGWRTLGAAGALFAVCVQGCAVTSDDVSATGSSETFDEGSYRLYFTNPLPAVIARLETKGLPEYSPTTADSWKALSQVDVARGRNLRAALVALMDRAKGANCAVLAAGFDLDSQEIADGMVQAKLRGCDVRLVTDGSTVSKADADPNDPHRRVDPAYREVFSALRGANIEIHHDGKRGAIMHNKFVVVAGEGTASVWTGSWNFTISDDEAFWNQGIQIHSREMARRYRVDFEALFARFGADGSVATRSPSVPLADRAVDVGGTPFEVYFPPSEPATPRITNVLASAQKSIHTLAFSFTSKEMIDAVVERAKAGIEVRGVFENSGACGGAYKPLSELGGKNVSLWRWPYGPTHFMHQKVFIVDGETVVFGSFNFSSNADKSNDENVLIVRDAAFAAEFEKSYQLIEAATELTPQPPPCAMVEPRGDDPVPVPAPEPAAPSGP